MRRRWVKRGAHQQRDAVLCWLGVRDAVNVDSAGRVQYFNACTCGVFVQRRQRLPCCGVYAARKRRKYMRPYENIVRCVAVGRQQFALARVGSDDCCPHYV